VKITRSRLKEIIKEELRLLKENNIISEDGHTDVPSARRKMKTSVEDAMQILQGLEAMSDEGELPSWWMGKVTLAADYLNKARDYFLVSEAKENAPKEGLSVEGVSEEQRVIMLAMLTQFTRDNNLRERVFNVVLNFLEYMARHKIGPDKVRQVLINKREETAPGDATAKPYLEKRRGEPRMPLEESLEDRINPEEVARLLAKKFPDLAKGRVTQKIGKNDLMVFIADEYDTSEQTAMQVVEEMIEEGIIGMMYPGFVNIISADFDEVNESIEKMVREELSRFLNENSEAKAAAEDVINDAKRKDIDLKQLATQDREKFVKTVSELLSTMVIDDVDDISVEEEIERILGV